MENHNDQHRIQPAGVFYFTHSAALHMTLAQLGIAKDQDRLTHTNYNTMKSRKWKTSKIGPFASNLAAVLFR
jgi:multiple inositol-polyphosphate phosphatase/2,3-bisphosphoglycerate 3-phosphatase